MTLGTILTLQDGRMVQHILLHCTKIGKLTCKQMISYIGFYGVSTCLFVHKLAAKTNRETQKKRAQQIVT
jgi:hypothetical protein